MELCVRVCLNAKAIENLDGYEHILAIPHTRNCWTISWNKLSHIQPVDKNMQNQQHRSFNVRNAHTIYQKDHLLLVFNSNCFHCIHSHSSCYIVAEMVSKENIVVIREISRTKTTTEKWKIWILLASPSIAHKSILTMIKNNTMGKNELPVTKQNISVHSLCDSNTRKNIGGCSISNSSNEQWDRVTAVKPWRHRATAMARATERKERPN